MPSEAGLLGQSDLDALTELQRDGAGTRIRTADLLITNQLLYQLSYTGNGCVRQDQYYMSNRE